MRMMQLVSLFCFTSALGFAGTWSGALVDAKCAASAERNHNVTDSSTVRDVGLEVRLCSPKAKTQSFAILQSEDGESAALDAAGNAKAAELVRQAGARSPFVVTINGEMNKHTIEVKSIAASR